MRIKAGRAGLTAGALVSLVSLVAGCGRGSGDGDGGRLASAELQGRWWTWASVEPERTNPVADPDGRQCARNQPKDVWFLAGTFGTQVARTCTVPDGTPLAFPLVNRFGDADDCADFMSTADGSAVLDGRKVDSDTYQGEPIQVRGTAGNAVTDQSGTFAVTGCGLWAQVPPLKPGRHTLSIRGRSGDDFSVGVDYTLVVEAG